MAELSQLSLRSAVYGLRRAGGEIPRLSPAGSRRVGP